MPWVVGAHLESRQVHHVNRGLSQCSNQALGEKNKKHMGTRKVKLCMNTREMGGDFPVGMKPTGFSGKVLGLRGAW